jgi:hypothetical protein
MGAAPPEVRIQIHTRDRTLETELFGPDGATESPGQWRCTRGATIARRGAWPGAPEIIELIVTLTSGVATHMFASWLYDRVKGRTTKLRIRRKSVEVTPEGIRKQLEESIDVSS